MIPVDIVIPTYNHAAFLREAVSSLVAQTYSEWRGIVVNNFSTDETTKVLDEFADPRLSRIDFENRGVIGAARNAGIAAGKSPFVAFLDSDDVWYPCKLAESIDAFHDGVDVVCHAEKWIETNGSTRIVKYGISGQDPYRSLLYRGNSLSTSAVVMRRSLLELLGGFDIDSSIVTAEDYDLWLRAARAGAGFRFLGTPYGEFRRRAGSESSKIGRNIDAERAVLEKHLEPPTTLLSRFRRRKRFALVDYGAGRAYQREGSISKAALCFKSSLRRYPLRLRPYLALTFLTRDAMRNKKSRHSDV